jgi:GNAT superfamily N-acetyltransferase
MTLEPLSGDLRAFAEDPGAFVAIGPDEERILTNRYCLTFTPGQHYWSASVQRLRFGVDDVAGGVAEIRSLVADRGRTAAAWTVGPSATPDGLLELLVAMGMQSESDAGSLILVLTEPPHIQASPFEVRLVNSYQDHLAAIVVANQGFAFPSEDALDERRRAHASFQSERAGGHSVRLLALDWGRPVAAGRAWFSPVGLYLGGGATIPSERRRGAMTALVARAWEVAVDRGTPTLVTLGGAISAAGLQRIGFRAVGRVRHLVDRSDR